MEFVYSHCCGLDVHKKSVVACAITPEGKEIRTFLTMTDDLVSMVDWIKNKGCTHVAMESTGSFWKPIYNLLELEDIQVLVVNAKHMKNVPGLPKKEQQSVVHLVVGVCLINGLLAPR